MSAEFFRSRSVPLYLLTVLAVVFSLFFSAKTAHAAILLVSTSTADDVSGVATSTVVAPAMNVTAGNFLFVSCGEGTTGDSSITVSDTAVNNFTALSAVQDTTNGTQVRAFYAKNATGNASDVVKCNYSPSKAYLSVNVLQYSGIDTASPFDVQATSTVPQTAATLSTRTFSTNSASEVIIAAIYQGGCSLGTYAAGSGYTQRTTDPDACSGTEDQIVSATQSNTSSSYTGLPAVGHEVAAATFKAAAAVSVVQKASSTTTGVTSLALPFASNVTANNLLVVAVSTNAVETISAPTDTLNSTWTLVENRNPGTTGTPAQASVYYAVAPSSGAETITAHIGASDNIHLHIYEVSGLATSNVLDTHSSNYQTSATAATVSTTSTTSMANEYVFAFFAQNNTGGTWTVGSGYGDTATTNNSGADGAFSEDKIVSSTGTQTATSTAPASDNITSVIATFKAASSGGGGPKRSRFIGFGIGR